MLKAASAGAANSPVWRGLGQRMYITTQGFAGGANWKYRLQLAALANPRIL